MYSKLTYFIPLIVLAAYLSMVFGAVGGAGEVGTRAHISKTVDKNEIGKAMSLLSTLDQLAPLLFMTISAYIFKYTVDTYPGAAFQSIAGLLFFPIFMMIWIDLYTDPPFIGMEGIQTKFEEDQNENALEQNANGLYKNESALDDNGNILFQNESALDDNEITQDEIEKENHQDSRPNLNENSIDRLI